MSTVTREIVVKAPVETVYNQWTQFEEFPRFMESVTEVRQLDDRHLLWRATLLGREVVWEAAIDLQVADGTIRWHSTSGPEHHGTVVFEPWDRDETKVHVELEYAPDGIAERLASATGLVANEVEGDLKRFKEFVESRQAATGAWRHDLPDEDRMDVRDAAELRQTRPGPASAPGGGPVVDERDGSLHS